jgi:hypothetical protein
MAVSTSELDDEACLDLVRGRDRTEFDRLVAEINRLRISLYHTERNRVEAAAEGAGLRAAVASLESRKFGSGGNTPLIDTTKGHPSSLNWTNKSRAIPQLLVEDKSEADSSLEELRCTVAELAAEMASLHCRQILATDYEVKAKRSTYVLGKLSELW